MIYWTDEQIVSAVDAGPSISAPPSLRDWLPEDHLAWFILEVVSQLDLSAIESAIQSKDSRGQRPYHPSMMVRAAGIRVLHGGVLVASHRAGVP